MPILATTLDSLGERKNGRGFEGGREREIERASSDVHTARNPCGRHTSVEIQ